MTQALHDWLARYRLPLSFFLFLALVFEWQLNDGGRPHALLDPRHLTPWLGLMLIATGLLLRSWAAGVIVKREALATEGPYALMRHPLYLGSFFIALGLAQVMEDRLAIAATMLSYWAIYLPVMRQEEHELARRFGAAWRDYAARTGMALPRWPLRLASGDWSWERWRRNREWRMWPKAALMLALMENLNAWTLGQSFPL